MYKLHVVIIWDIIKIACRHYLDKEIEEKFSSKSFYFTLAIIFCGEVYIFQVLNNRKLIIWVCDIYQVRNVIINSLSNSICIQVNMYETDCKFIGMRMKKIENIILWIHKVLLLLFSLQFYFLFCYNTAQNKSNYNLYLSRGSNSIYFWKRKRTLIVGARLIFKLSLSK